MRRERSVIVAVNCTVSAPTCFCTSTETGPQSTSGFDLALTELLSESRHEFLVEEGSEIGLELLAALPLRAASSDDVDAARAAVSSAARGMQRQLDTSDVHDLLLNNLEHPRWDEVAKRCLACANCTMVCPTCFCSTVKDVSDLSGHEVERRQTWDSCFTADHSYLHGGSVHSSIKSRYRQWLTHKLATWIDQFGTSGCVGCGRCITWCPAAIDLTEEIRKLREETVFAETSGKVANPIEESP
jgi:formate hydrogenlyase subunit 6/NADH:ubiquinone oxidoreductase subunit I